MHPVLDFEIGDRVRFLNSQGIEVIGNVCGYKVRVNPLVIERAEIGRDLTFEIVYYVLSRGNEERLIDSAPASFLELHPNGEWK